MAVPLILKRVATSIGIRKLISKDTKQAEIPQGEVNKIKRGLGNFAKGIIVKTKTNSKEVIRKVDKFESVLERAIDKGVKQAGFQLLEIIRTKTQKGIDFNSKPFAPYSEGYLKKLQKEGKETNVDLWYSGKMLGALTPNQAMTKTGKHKITLGFARAEERNKALWNQVINSPKRQFFGFNNRTEKIINKSFNQFIEKELKRARI